jgi:hypothetical protein
LVLVAEPLEKGVSQAHEGNHYDDSATESAQKNDLVSLQQQIPTTRFSNRIQEQILAKGGGSMKSPRGTSLNNKNSFAVLDNDVIADLARAMGICVSEENFETFDLMKDIEMARHTLDKVKRSKYLILMRQKRKLR